MGSQDPLSNILHTDPEVLHLPKAQLVPASPAWDKSWGPRGFWDPSWVSHTPGHHPIAAGHKINHAGCPLIQWVPQGHSPAATPSSPCPQAHQERRQRWLQSHHPSQGGTGGHSKSHRAMDPPSPCSAVPLPSVGTTLCRDPHEVPRCHGVSRHRDTLQPRARAAAGTDGTAWDTLSGTKLSPQGGDTGSWRCPAGSAGTLLQVSNWCSQVTIRQSRRNWG